MLVHNMRGVPTFSMPNQPPYWMYRHSNRVAQIQSSALGQRILIRWEEGNIFFLPYYVGCWEFEILCGVLRIWNGRGGSGWGIFGILLWWGCTSHFGAGFMRPAWKPFPLYIEKMTTVLHVHIFFQVNEEGKRVTFWLIKLPLCWFTYIILPIERICLWIGKISSSTSSCHFNYSEVSDISLIFKRTTCKIGLY